MISIRHFFWIVSVLFVVAAGSVAYCDEAPVADDLSTNVGEAPASFGASERKPALCYDDGTMEDRMPINLSGATVEFMSDGKQMISAVQFYGARYSQKEALTEPLTVIVSDADFKPVRRVFKPVNTITPGREIWQSVAVVPPVEVNGKFYVTLTYNSTKESGVYIGLDSSSASGFSFVGVPGTVPTDVDAPFNWMIKAIASNPELVKAARAAMEAAQAKAVRQKPASSVKVDVKVGAAKSAPAAKPASKPAQQVIRPSVTSSKTFVYRDPHRKLSFVTKAPRLPKGSGRVEVKWTGKPATVELNYVGKPKRILENLDVEKLVVDFPVPEPGVFNISVIRAGKAPVEKQFRVVSGGRQFWNADQNGSAVPTPAKAPVVKPMKPENTGTQLNEVPVVPVIEPATELGEPRDEPESVGPAPAMPMPPPQG